MSTYKDRQMASLMNASPAYAQYMLAKNQPNPADALTNAYVEMEQRLAQDEAERQRAHLMTRGDVPIPYRKPEYQAPSPIEQWGQKISAMMGSGNPQLQEEGIRQMQKYQESQIGKPREEKRSNFAQIALDLGYKPGTKQFNDFILSQANKQTKMFEEKRVSTDESKSLRFKPEFGAGKVDPGMLWSDIAGKVESFSSSGEKEQANKVKSSNIAAELEGMLFGEKGIYAGVGNSVGDRLVAGIKANVQQFAQTDPRYRNYEQFALGALSPLVKSLGEVGALAEGDVERAKALVPVTTGLNPDSPAVAREKIAKLRRLAQIAESGKATPEEVSKILYSDAERTEVVKPIPAVGTVVSGYKFLGGDPNSESSWRKL